MRIPVVAPALILAVLLVVPCLAQETTGNIEGQLRDADGKPVAFANVVVSGPALQGNRGVMSTSEGYFGIFKLPVGKYTLKITHVSYQGATFEDVLVQLGKTTTLGEVRLAPTVHEVPAIVVTEKKLLIDPSTAAMSANIPSEEFRDLPIDRDYKSMTPILPHANSSFFGDEVNFAGATGAGNKYFVDGVETTDPFLGATGTELPYNFVKELQVRTGGYEAEYRSALGGIVNVISHSGGNEFHGQGFGFFVNNQFTGDPRLGVGEPVTGDFTEYDIGINLGGPIKRDKLWFFVAYNPTFRRQDVDIPGLGFYPDETTKHIFAGKLDWRATKRTNVMLTILGDPSTRHAVGDYVFGAPVTPLAFENPDPALMDITAGSTNIMLRGTHMFSDAFFMEGSISRNTRWHEQKGLTELGREEFTFIDTETGTYSGGMGENLDVQSEQYTVDARATWMLGRHTLKGGLEYRDNMLDFREDNHFLYRYGDSSYTDIHFTTYDGTVRNRIPSVFVQDTWRVTDRLRINAGLRWDGQFLIDSSGDVAQRITDQYQPRAGLVYQPGTLGSQKLFGSYGRFYQDLGMVVSNFHHNEFTTYAFTDYDHDPRVDPSGGDGISGGGFIYPWVEGLEGQYYDEFALGYELQIRDPLVIGARGVYRTLGQGIEDGVVEATGEYNFGNPGKGDLSNYPEIEREYVALELMAQLLGGDRYRVRAYYVYSRNRGNYTGLFESEYASNPFVNYTAAFDLPEMSINGTGLLPNDRTHVLKLSGAYRLGYGLTAGTVLNWQSGTPLSVLEASSWSYPWLNFAQERGSAGRTPSIWDLNLRFVYDFSYALHSSMRPRFIVDIFHIGSQQEPVDYDEIRNFEQDAAGNQISPNPTFGLPTRYQPPTALRLGFEWDF